MCGNIRPKIELYSPLYQVWGSITVNEGQEYY